MKHRPGNSRGGFTVLEITIVAALAALLVALLYTPMMNGLVMVQREGTLLNMFRAGDLLTSRLASLLQPAVLPVTYENASGDTTSLQWIANDSRRGFGRFGDTWKKSLMNGTDFVPFTLPVSYVDRNGNDTRSRVDSDGLPVLGVVMPDGRKYIGAGGYAETTTEDGFAFSLGSAPLNVGLTAMDPSRVNITDALPPMLDPSWSRFSATKLNFRNGFAYVRFIAAPETPDRSNVLNETNFLGPGAHFDLNQDGSTNDVFLRGSLCVEYPDSTGPESPAQQTFFPLQNQSVLLQLNTNDPGYVPIFKLIGGFGGSNSPSGDSWDETASSGGDNYVLLVRLLLFDELTQRGTVLATGRRDGRQFLTRQFQTAIELRNMAFR